MALSDDSQKINEPLIQMAEASLESARRLRALETTDVLLAFFKTTTGDPPLATAHVSICINTFDGTIKMFVPTSGGGEWSTLGTFTP